MKLPDDHVVCGLCREIVPKEDTKQFVASYDWGSFTGTAEYDRCCKSHETDEQGHPLGQYKRAYA